jgi:hypothetical protein
LWGGNRKKRERVVNSSALVHTQTGFNLFFSPNFSSSGNLAIIHCQIVALMRSHRQTDDAGQGRYLQNLPLLDFFCCQFLLPGGNIGLRYVLQLLYGVKSQNCRKTSITTEGGE